jgi:membrane associated rhomboid family serine protease
MQIVPVFGAPKTPPVLYWITGLMLGLEALLQLADNGLFGPVDLRGLVISYGAFWDFLFPPGSVDRALFPGQSYTMLFTYAFLHAGTLHVLMNSVIFLALSKTLSLAFGTKQVLLGMLVGAVSSALIFGVLGDTSSPMIGASGVVFCLIGLWLYSSRVEAISYGRPARSVISVLVGLIVIHVILHVFMSGTIAWQAHLGGFISGYFILPWFIQRPIK